MGHKSSVALLMCHILPADFGYFFPLFLIIVIREVGALSPPPSFFLPSPQRARVVFGHREEHGEVSQKPISGLIAVTRGALWMALEDKYLEICVPSS